MNLEHYLVDVLGIKKIFLDPASLSEQTQIQNTRTNPHTVFEKGIKELQESSASTLFIVVQNTLSATESTMIQKMSEALNWSENHQQVSIPETQDKAQLLQLIEASEQWLRHESHRKLILFTNAFQTHPLLVPFFDIHHARVCDLPKNISASPEIKKITWDKIKILKIALR